MIVRKEIKDLVEKSIKELQKEGFFSDFLIPEIRVEKKEEEIYGDYSVNIAMALSRNIKKSPLETAEAIGRKIESQNLKIFEKIEIKKPGFINFFLSKDFLQQQIKEILNKKEKFGEIEIGKGKKANLEFISANPTGPLTLGNGRGGFCGDVLASVFEKAGYKATREYYINDLGEQISKLGHSIVNDSEAVYKGDYINELRGTIKEKDAYLAGEKAAEIILEKMIKPAIIKMGIKFDVWFSEKSLLEKKEISKALNQLKRKDLTYEQEGALWFKSSLFGDDKDRVLIKSDGQTTYLASDFAYLNNKIKRGFDRLVFIWGADHFGYINRIKAAAEIMGFDKKETIIIIMQLVRLFEKGKEVRMSKRAGVYVTIDELIDEVGLDVARFFFLTKSPSTHFNFDMDLAKQQSDKNPVYYIQYAHARICSIIKKINDSSKPQAAKYELLSHPSELALIKQLIIFPEIIEDIVKDCQVQRLPQYATNLAAVFHQFYRDCQVISKNKELTIARLSLLIASKTILKNTLDLIGISAPEKM